MVPGNELDRFPPNPRIITIGRSRRFPPSALRFVANKTKLAPRKLSIPRLAKTYIMHKFNFPLKYAVNDACLMWRIIPSKWCVLVVRAAFGFAKSAKCGLPTAPIGIFGYRPKTLCPCANPPKCCTWAFKRIIVVAGDSFHSFCVKQFASLFPII